MNSETQHVDAAIPDERGWADLGPDAPVITYSILSDEALLAEVDRAYDLRPATCRLVLPSMNDTYMLTTATRPYMARVYRARWRSSDDIAFELELLKHLAARGVTVSTAVPTRTGSLVLPLDAPEGTRHLVVFTYATGDVLLFNDSDRAYLAGRLLAAIHTESDDFTSTSQRPPLDLTALVDAPLAALQRFFAHRPKDWDDLAALAARLRRSVVAAAADGLDFGPCHGDFAGGNISIEGSTATVFDFDLCGRGWRAFDLAAIAEQKKNGAQWDRFVEGYREIRPLSGPDLAAVPLFEAVRHIWRLGLQAANVDDWGILRLADWALDKEMKFLRDWAAERGE